MPFPRTLLADTLRQPERLRGYDLAVWDLLVRQARHADLLARLGFVIADAGLRGQIPEAPLRHIDAAIILADKQRRDVLWEIRCLRRSLADLDAPVLLLKGAAYVACDLPPARGRLFSDIDILIPSDHLAEAEALLHRNGWVDAKLSDYDQRYYRRWMHELPPLRNIERDSVLDLHHTIVPPIGRTPVDAAPLIAARVPTPHGFAVFAPADMVLHAALHLFNEGQPQRALRDLDDINRLLRHCAADPGFWPSLVARAEELRIAPTLRLAVAACRRLLGTPVPDEASRRLFAGGRGVGERAVERLFAEILHPDHASCRSPGTGMARWLLYVRSHYLRMPLYLLLPHLVRKAFTREPRR